MIAYMMGATLLAVGLCWGVDPAWAEEAAQAAATPAWRAWWDAGWRVANFVILAFFLYKVGKQPLVDFLTNQRATVAENIRDMEKAKAEAEAERQELEAKTRNLARELADYEEMLSQVAQREQQTMLDDAENESRMIIDRAGIWAEQAMRRARRQLAAEMLEEATDLAREKIRKAINDQDQARFIDNFTTQISDQPATR